MTTTTAIATYSIVRRSCMAAFPPSIVHHGAAAPGQAERRQGGRLRAYPVGVRLPSTAAGVRPWRQERQAPIVHSRAALSRPRARGVTDLRVWP